MQHIFLYYVDKSGCARQQHYTYKLGSQGGGNIDDVYCIYLYIKGEQQGLLDVLRQFKT